MEDSAETSEPYHKWLDIPPEFCPPNHYVLLGVDDFSDDTSAIDAAAKSRTASLHQIAAGPDRKIIQRLLGEVAVARRTLLNDTAKAEYDAWLATPEEESSDSDANSFHVIPDSKSTEKRSANSRKKKTVAQEDVDDKPATRRRRTTTWDSYKLHLLSASVLACAVGVFALMNRGGGRRASAVPDAPSTFSPARQKPARQKSRQPAASRAIPKSRNTAVASKTRPANSSKRSSSGLSGPDGLDMAEFMKEGATEVPEGGFASFDTDTSNLPAPSEANKVKLPAKWWSGLQRLDLFGEEFDTHFPSARGKGKIFDAQNGELVLKRAVGNDRYRRLTVASKRLAMGEAISIDTSLRPNTDSKILLGLAIGKRVVFLQATGQGISVKTKYDPLDHKEMHIKNLKIRRAPAKSSLFLIRDKKDAKKIHWVLQVGGSGLRGKVFAELSEDDEPIQVTFACPNEPIKNKVAVSNFRFGTLEKPPNWIR